MINRKEIKLKRTVHYLYRLSYGGTGHDEARKCPFCGKRDVALWALDAVPHSWYRASCIECGAWGPSGMTEEKATDNWNHRKGE